MSDRPTILLVDDDAVNRQTMAWLFRDAGYTVVEATGGQEALARARDHPPELAVLDVNLPDLSGFEVCRRMKAHPATMHTSILHLSAVFVGSGDRSHGLEEGADGYLIKPVEPREILATVSALLRVRAAEEAARSAAQQWRTTFDAISEAVCLLAPDGRILRCNRSFRELVDQPFATLIGARYGLVLETVFGAEGAHLLEALGKPGDKQARELHLGSRWYWLTVDPILEEDGTWSGSVHILADVTAQKEMEQHLRSARTMEAVGRLAGGIAHDFNNLLTAVLGNAALLLRNLPPDDPDHDLAVTIEQAAWRAADLTRQLLGYSRRTLLWLEAADLNRPLLDVMRTMQHKLPANVRLEVCTGKDLWMVQADPLQIGQVLDHLCRNALEAMPEGGVLAMESANEVISEEQAVRWPEARAGEFVRVSVSDTGGGIPLDLQSRIFDPFFTTKPIGKGSGLGLAMVGGIVKQHQGWVECQSRPGQGTRFDLYLPRTPRSAGQPSVQASRIAARSAGGSATILVASDNDALRDLAGTILRQNGFQVLQAVDGSQAVALFTREKEKIDVVLLDLGLPPLTSAKALEALRAIDPAVRCLIAGPGGSTRTVRPYREGELVQAVRAALAEAS